MTFRKAGTAGRGALLALLGALFLQGTLWADEPEVRYCFNDWPPYARMEGEIAAGISIDILREASARAGVAASFVELPWNRCLEMVRSGELDAVIDAVERPEYLQGPTSFSYYTNTVWVREEFPTDSLDFEALRGRNIGLIDGYKYPDDLRSELRRAGMTIGYSVNDRANIRKLAFDRVDAIIGDFVSTLIFAQENDLKLKPLTPTHSADRLYTSFNRDRGEIHARIDAALAAMIADGSIDRVYRRYLGKSLDEIAPR